jgi:hypothetical protein
MQVIGHKTKVQSLFDGLNSTFVVNISRFPCSWIRIRIPITDLDPGEPNHCVSKRIQIHNTGHRYVKCTNQKRR